jgi:hypothetical protein
MLMLAHASLFADTVSLIPIADATLFEVAPSNSLGGAEWITAGTTQNYTRNRALMKFDVAGSIPAGSQILGATLTVNVTGVPRDGYAQEYFSVRRMLTSWGEGHNVSADPSSPGLGSLAQPGDATWLHRFAQTTNTWMQPGGAEDIEFSITSSALSVIQTLGEYTFESLPSAREDVQFWLDNPALNFGWMLRCEAEEQNFTGRRFASRELNDPTVSPRLDITFVPPPKFSGIHRTNSSVVLSFDVEAGSPYAVEYRGFLGSTNAWLTLTNVGTASQMTNVTVFDSIPATQRFYRIRRD